MSKPSTLPRWADTVTSDPTRVKAPTSGKADVGWAVGEQPAAPHINWLLNLIYTWLVYLNGLAGEAFTWTATHVFNAPVYINAGVASSVILNSTLTVIGTTLLHTLGISGSVAITGAVTVDGSIGITTGNLTALDVRYTTIRKRNVSPLGGWDYPQGSGLAWVPNVFGQVVNPNTAGTPRQYMRPLHVEVGETFTLKVRVKHGTATAGAMVMTLFYTDSTGAQTTVSSVSSGASTAVQLLTVATGHVVLADCVYQVQFDGNGGTTTCQREIHQIVMEVTRP